MCLESSRRAGLVIGKKVNQDVNVNGDRREIKAGVSQDSDITAARMFSSPDQNHDVEP